MDKRRIKNITEEHFRIINKYIKKITLTIDADIDPEAIHQFRVEYKKLRAFLRMISQQSRLVEKINIPKALKDLYHISGSIRELQLQRQHIAEATIQELVKPESYFNLLHFEINKLCPRLSKVLLLNPAEQSEMKIMKSLPEKFLSTDFNIYIKKKWNTVDKIISSARFRDETMHLIRKKLKDIFYMQKIFKPTGHRKLDNKYFESLLTELGTFQDKHIEIALLKPSWLKKLNKYDRQLLYKVKIKWLKDKAAMRLLLSKKLPGAFVKTGFD